MDLEALLPSGSAGFDHGSSARGDEYSHLGTNIAAFGGARLRAYRANTRTLTACPDTPPQKDGRRPINIADGRRRGKARSGSDASSHHTFAAGGHKRGHFNQAGHLGVADNVQPWTSISTRRPAIRR